MPDAVAALITTQAIEDLSPGLFKFALRMVRRREEAEDLVQETWFSALQTAQTFEGRSSLRTWLTSIMRRRIADRFRRTRTTELLLEENHASDDASAAEQLDTCVAAAMAGEALANLTEQERVAITLCDIEELERDEASERMGITRGHLRVLLHRGRQRVAHSLRTRGVEVKSG
jgi:RNA polymerase sigma-70 factor, ECF subfamily